MPSSLAQIEADALGLSEDERSVLAEHLVASLQGPALTENELAWVEEADRRYNDFKSDPIVEEIRRYRKEHAAEFNSDLERIVADLRKKEQASKQVFFNPGPKLLTKKAT